MEMSRLSKPADSSRPSNNVHDLSTADNLTCIQGHCIALWAAFLDIIALSAGVSARESQDWRKGLALNMGNAGSELSND